MMGMYMWVILIEEAFLYRISVIAIIPSINGVTCTPINTVSNRSFSLTVTFDISTYQTNR